MVLEGVDVVVLLINWLLGVGYIVDYVFNCWVFENYVYFVLVNCVGEECGFKFVGKSKICELNGGNLVFVDYVDEVILIVEVDFVILCNKYLVRVFGKYEIDCFKDC